MLFRVLGATELPAPVMAAKPRLVALLLLTAGNRPVPLGTLVDEVWPRNPPTSAVANIRTYLSRLRALFPGRITSGTGGYLFEVAAGELDLAEFTALVAAGRSAAPGRPEAARESLAAALRLWRGQPFAGEPAGPVLQARAAAAQDDHLAAVELYSELLLQNGDPAAAQTLLRRMVHEYPLRERLRSLLVLALYRGGDPAAALTAYQDARTALAAELGIDPGPELAAVHRSVLRRDRRLLSTGPGGPDGVVAPFQLPPVVADFVGREPEIAHLAKLLRRREPVPGAGLTAVLGGMAGVGKSTLAVRVAHEVAELFPDGCLYADLQRTDGTATPLPQVLGRFLRAMGVPGESLPHDQQERADQFRTLLAGRRVLIVADNATEAGQVRALMPGPGSALLVTSRALLTVPGAHLLQLRPLSRDAGVALLERIAGGDAVAAEPEAAAALAELCGGLPLSIRAAAIRSASLPGPALGQLVARLSDEHQRLDRLSIGDLDVRASLALSYRRLDPAALALLRAMSLLPMRTFAPWLPAALAGIGEPEAFALTERLCDAQVLTRAGAERYALHDLVRLSAAELPGPPAGELVAAAARVFLAAALTANRRLPGRPMTLPAPAAPDARAGATPVEWFESELDGIRALVPLLAGTGQLDLAARLATATVNFCVLRGRIDDWAATHDVIPDDAVLSPATAALLALSVGSLHRFRDDNRAALPRLRRSYELFRALRDAPGMAEAALGWSVAAQQLGRLDEALAAYDRAAELLPVLGGTPATGYVHLAFRQPISPSPEEESAALGRALEIFEATHEAWGAAEVHTFLAAGYRARQRAASAARHARAAVLAYTELRDETQLTVAEIVLADAYLELGSIDHARALAARCLARATRLGHRWGVASARRTAGRIELLDGRPAAAAELLTAAEAGFREMGFTRAAELTRSLLERASGTH
ncbi:DNA-binding SARP family transcriptional activator [Catenuloplanes nepalensis]|uniref:DNA-binding SARP family transcriptional activator n=1 Tax=Catenuloplanes nepalensis TaxID=587533 RepID=A0ABT9MWB0_9ACTN|nr:BTAD domain-containing putative transcriptional regulator [Catenuloplanes nepalensis]MDP9795731.1 DNA-binding SARP family transcriptional activator [Catenuloplanes nepalensis]